MFAIAVLLSVTPFFTVSCALRAVRSNVLLPSKCFLALSSPALTRPHTSSFRLTQVARAVTSNAVLPDRVAAVAAVGEAALKHIQAVKAASLSQ